MTTMLIYKEEYDSHAIQKWYMYYVSIDTKIIVWKVQIQVSTQEDWNKMRTETSKQWTTKNQQFPGMKVANLR